MSKTPRFDALLVRALAAELWLRLGEARLHTARFDPARRALRLATGRGTLAWDLRPTGAGPRLLPARREEGNLPIAAGSRIDAVRAIPDDRVLDIEIVADPAATGTAVARIILELFGPHSNAYALDREGTILALLRDGSATRPAARGSAWRPPAPSGRAGVESPLPLDAFRKALPDPGADRMRRALIERVAWTSPLNAGAIVGIDDPPGELEDVHRRYLDILSPEVAPVLLDPEGDAQPYPRPLPGVPSRPAADLLAAFAMTDAADAREADAEAALAVIASRRNAVLRRLERLRAQLEGARAEAGRSRHHAGLLLSQPDAVRKGLSSLELDDFAGGRVRIELDPALDGAANAERLYALARRRERAARRIPAMLDAGEREAGRLAALEAAIRRGETPTLPATLRRAEVERSGRVKVLPYRRYRSRTGLEIRVGRSARANDDLTRRHARPDDIWLHARDVAGAHVVLVWGRRDQNPPESDLRDAAVLAALHSRARTSGMVPVDWTRRKYVRKPRKALPGAVILERGKTLFVEPDPSLEQRLRYDAAQP